MYRYGAKETSEICHGVSMRSVSGRMYRAFGMKACSAALELIDFTYQFYSDRS